MSESGPGAHPTPAQAVEAGLYYFAREDFLAARKWWEYALAIDPHNVRAHECLRILGRTLGEAVSTSDMRPQLSTADVRARTAARDTSAEPMTSARADRGHEVRGRAAAEPELTFEEAEVLPLPSPDPDEEPTEAVARGGGSTSAATRVRDERAALLGPSGSAGPLPAAPAESPSSLDAWSRPASSVRPRVAEASGSVDAWSRPAPSARPQAAPIAPPGSWSDRAEGGGVTRRAAVSSSLGAADAWSRPAQRPPSEDAIELADEIDLGSIPVPAPALTLEVPPPEPLPSSGRPPSRDLQPVASQLREMAGPRLGTRDLPTPRAAPYTPAEPGAREAAGSGDVPHERDRPGSGDVPRSGDVPGPRVATRDVPAPRVATRDVPGSRVATRDVPAGRAGALPPMPPMARPIPSSLSAIGPAEPIPASGTDSLPRPEPVSAPPIASSDLGRYPSLPHRPLPLVDEAGRPSVLRFDPLGFDLSASWDTADDGPPSPSTLERWSRPSASPVPAPRLAPPTHGWDPGAQLAIDGGIGVLDHGAARRQAEGRAAPVLPADPEWDAALRNLTEGSSTGAAGLGSLDPAMADPASLGAALPEVSRFPATADLVPALPVPPATPRVVAASPIVERSRTPDVTVGLSAQKIDRSPRPQPLAAAPLAAAPLAQASVWSRPAALPLEDSHRAGIPTADMPRTRPSFDPFGPPSDPPPALDVTDRVDSIDPFGDAFVSEAPVATRGAGSAVPPSVFSAPAVLAPVPTLSATPLPESRTFSVEASDVRGGARSSPGLDEPSPEEIMGERAPVRAPPSGDFDVIIEEPEEAPSALEFALSAFEAVSEPDMIAVDPRPSAPALPWDEGPAETSHVTLIEDNDDAVAELTPLPMLDRAPLFQMPGTPPPPVSASNPRTTSGDVPRATPTPQAPTDEPAQLFERARSRFLLHDFDGALELLEKIPPHHAVYEQAKDVLAETRSRLDHIYSTKIGSLDAAPRVLLSGDQLIWLNLNHRAGFILSQIDGGVTYDDLISLSGMPRLDTLRILCTLLQEGVIGTD